MDFNDKLLGKRFLINEEIKKRMAMGDSYQRRIFEAVSYSILNGGKRLRPIMALESYELFNKDVEKILPFAIAIEMIHTYSLIHDDLPSMDDDDFRRGKPTNHKVFGEAMAILAGDGLLNLAFETMGDYIINNCHDYEDCKRYTRALMEISKYSGINGMIGGQVVDLLSNFDSMSEEKLIFMYKTKTAGLIQAALVAGAIIGGASEEEIECIREYGLNLGLAYQIRDDILDDEEDKAIKKLTYLTYHDFEKAEEAVISYSNRAIESLEGLEGRDISFFLDLTRKLSYRKK